MSWPLHHYSSPQMQTPTPTISEGISSLLQIEQTQPNAEVRAKDLFANAKVSLDALSAAFESLHGQTLQMAASKTAAGPKEMTMFRQEIDEQEKCHVEGLDDIQRIIDDLLANQVVEKMRDEVEQEISAQLDEIVKDCVGECLKVHIPEDLQLEVEESKRELERARVSLYNSESRRMNAKLRSDKPDVPLDTLAMANGTISAHFPRDLNAMFSLEAETCKRLFEDYDLPHVSDSRDKNLNRFMQFCGVRYQLVRPAGQGSN